MRWFGSITLKVSMSISCPLDSLRCGSYNHYFQVQQTAQTPLLLAEERAIRERLQQQLDLIVQKFLEAHK